MDEKYTLMDFVSIFMAWADTQESFDIDPADRLSYGIRLYQDLARFMEDNPPIQWSTSGYIWALSQTVAVRPPTLIDLFVHSASNGAITNTNNMKTSSQDWNDLKDKTQVEKIHWYILKYGCITPKKGAWVDRPVSAFVHDEHTAQRFFARCAGIIKNCGDTLFGQFIVDALLAIRDHRAGL